MNHWGKVLFRWIYWNILLPGKELPVPALMSMAGKQQEDRSDVRSPRPTRAGEARPAWRDQLADLTELVAADRAERERWRELVHELTPSPRAPCPGLGRARGPQPRRHRRRRHPFRPDRGPHAAPAGGAADPVSSAGELAHEVTSLTGDGMAPLSDAWPGRGRGYFDAARCGGGTLDRMVRLSANDADRSPAPSSLALLRRLRDPQVRRGLAVALDLLGALGADAGPHPDARPIDRSDRQNPPDNEGMTPMPVTTLNGKPSTSTTKASSPSTTSGTSTSPRCSPRRSASS